MSIDLRQALSALAPEPESLDTAGLVRDGLRRRQRRALTRGAVAAVAAAAVLPLGWLAQGAAPPSDRLIPAAPTMPTGPSDAPSRPPCALPRADADLDERRRNGAATPRQEAPADTAWLFADQAQPALQDLDARFTGRTGIVGTYLDFKARQLVVVFDPGTDAGAAATEVAAVSQGRVGARALVGCRASADIERDVSLLQADPTLASMRGMNIRVDPPTGTVTVGVPPERQDEARSLPVVRLTGAEVNDQAVTLF